MTTLNRRLTILSRTGERMKHMDHLPGQLVSLLEKTAALQAESGQGIHLDLSGLTLDQSPLCPPDMFPLDHQHIRSLACRIIGMILDHPDQMPSAMVDAAQKFQTGLDSRTLDLDGALTEILAQDLSGEDIHPGPILADWAAQTPGAPAALTFLALAAATPCLEACGTAMAEAAGLDSGQIHPTGACPVCGSRPYLLELRGKEGGRYAHCSLCRQAFRIRRLACPSCDTNDGDQLQYLTAQGEEGFRVDTCDSCKTYVKTIDFRELDREAFAPLNDLESLALDCLAQDQGYARLAPSVWGI